MVVGYDLSFSSTFGNVWRIWSLFFFHVWTILNLGGLGITCD
jgi:hypothetical protein